MQAKFTQGSIFKHISVMTFASTIGLLAIFMVDLVDLYWLSLLGVVELAAAIGYAGSILFFTQSLSIGLAIGCGALISRAVGSGDQTRTQEMVAHIFISVAIVCLPILLALLVFMNPILEMLGAQGEAAMFARQYLFIILPTMPVMAIAMSCGGVSRALGFAKQSMWLTLIGGFVNAVLDPFFIFTLDLGVQGAAIATLISRFAMLAYGLWLVIKVNQLITWPNLAKYWQDVKQYSSIALPASATNLSTPIAVAFVTASMAQFGDSAVAANAVISKLQPLAFAGLFALSGAIGPIAGQNLGAKNVDRIFSTLKESVKFVLLYCVVACGLLFVLTGFIINVFEISDESKPLVKWFCFGLSTVFVFNGITFVTNAMFNNLGAAKWATIFNFAKATIFTIPFVSVGAHYGGPVGIFIGLYIGAIIIALLGLWKNVSVIKQIELENA
ncbi:MATE family efflux transporter [Marinicellulosiphila megalodicopiae]|uniref:MATE family efflux transporter n=1 Tax=Marinicellulosiphila megalodicopiae TaxID=2724896 RepID=UPI003BAF64F3